MLSTFTKGTENRVPAWLAGEFAASRENTSEHAPRLHARVEHTSGDPFILDRSMHEMRGAELFDFLARFVSESTKPGVTLAELGFTHPRSRVSADLKARGETVSQHASAFAGIGLFTRAVGKSMHPEGPCSGCSWASLQISPTE